MFPSFKFVHKFGKFSCLQKRVETFKKYSFLNFEKCPHFSNKSQIQKLFCRVSQLRCSITYSVATAYAYARLFHAKVNINRTYPLPDPISRPKRHLQKFYLTRAHSFAKSLMQSFFLFFQFGSFFPYSFSFFVFHIS